MADYTLDEGWHGMPFNNIGVATWNLDWAWHGKPFVADGPEEEAAAARKWMWVVS